MSKEKAAAGRLEVLNAVLDTNDKNVIKTLGSLRASIEKRKGGDISELGLMVLVGQVMLVEIITRLDKGQVVPPSMIGAAIGSAAETLSLYMNHADKTITTWEESDTDWNSDD